jgi:hypothetical protein
VAFLSIGIGLFAPLPWLFGLVDGVGPSLVQHLVARYSAAQLVFVTHALFGGIALLAGPWQLMPRLRARRPRLHRATGYVYVGAVTLAGTAGMMMAPYAFGGVIAQIGFGGLAIGWLATTAIGLQRILRGDQAAHRVWMTTSFALAFAAVSLRLQSIVFGFAGVPVEISYPIVAWSSWVPNVLLVRALLVANTGARRSTAHDVAIHSLAGP